MKKKTELKVGDIWQVPKTLKVRMIVEITNFLWYIKLFCPNEDPDYPRQRWLLAVDRIEKESFKMWGLKNDVVLIGHYDFKTGKAKVTKREQT